MIVVTQSLQHYVIWRRKLTMYRALNRLVTAAGSTHKPHSDVEHSTQFRRDLFADYLS